MSLVIDRSLPSALESPQDSPSAGEAAESSPSPSLWVSCLAPFADPAPETEEALLQRMRERIELEDFHASLQAAAEEKSDILLRRFLRRHYFDAEVALMQWHAFVEWRHALKLDEISEAEIAHEREEGVFSWRGENKEGLPCCVITGRMLDPSNRKGSFSSFRKHLIKFVDEGMFRADQNGKEKICIIYDRRGLEYDNIDPNLYQFCNNAIAELKEWYGDRIGVIYVVHTNLLFWTLYTLLVRPFLALFSKDNRIVVVEESSELLAHFSAEQLFLLSYDPSGSDDAEQGNTAAEEPSAETEIQR